MELKKEVRSLFGLFFDDVVVKPGHEFEFVESDSPFLRHQQPFDDIFGFRTHLGIPWEFDIKLTN